MYAELRKELDPFFRAYFAHLETLVAPLSRDNRERLFPRVFYTPRKLTFTYSEADGFAVEATSRKEEAPTEFRKTAKPIEQAVLNGGPVDGCLFSVKAPGGYLARFSMEAQPGVGFVDLAPDTDLRLLDVTLGRAGQPPRQVEFLWVFSHHDLAGFRKEDPQALAVRDFNALLASGLLSRQGANPLDLAVDSLERATDTLRKLLDQGGIARDELPTFLLSNPLLLDPSTEGLMGALPQALEALDGALALRDGGYRLVSLKPATARLCIPTGFTGDAERATREVAEARQWVRDHLPEARRVLPNIVDPAGLVVMGRKHDLTVEDQKRVQQWNAAHPEVRLATYDDLYESALVLRANLLRLMAPPPAR